MTGAPSETPHFVSLHSGNDYERHGTLLDLTLACWILSCCKQAAEPLYCQSVGWLLTENKNCKVNVPHIGGEKNGNTMMQGCGDLTIPARAIIKMTVLQPS